MNNRIVKTCLIWLALAAFAFGQRQAEQIVVDDIADLLTVAFQPLAQLDGRIIKVKGTAGGDFVYAFASAVATDGGITIDGPGGDGSGTGTGRFIRQWDEQEVRLAWFGVVGDGVTDDADKINAAAAAARVYSATLTDGSNQERTYRTADNLDLTDINVRLGGRILVDVVIPAVDGGTASENNPLVGVDVGGLMTNFDGGQVDIKVRRAATTWGDFSVGVRVKRARNATFRWEIRGFDKGAQVRPTVDGNLVAFTTFERCEILFCKIGWEVWTELDTYVNANYWRGGSVFVAYDATVNGTQRGFSFRRDGTSDIADNVFDAVNLDSGTTPSSPFDHGAIVFECYGNASGAFTRLSFENFRLEVGVNTYCKLLTMAGLCEIDIEYLFIDADKWVILESGTDNYADVRKRKETGHTIPVGRKWTYDSESDPHFDEARIFDVSTGAELIDIFNGSPSINTNNELAIGNGSQAIGHVLRKRFAGEAAFVRTNAIELAVMAFDADSTATSIDFADANPDTITRSAGSFVTDGFVAGQYVVTYNCKDATNNEAYLVTNVSATVLTLDAAETVTTSTGDTTCKIRQLIAPKTTADTRSLNVAATDNDEIDLPAMSSDSWLADGFRAGEYIEILNAFNAENNGIYRVVAVTSTKLTLEEGANLTENADDDTMQIERVPPIHGRNTAAHGTFGWKIRGDWCSLASYCKSAFIGFAPSFSGAGVFREFSLTSETENFLQKESPGGTIVKTFVAGDTSPSVKGASSFVTANTGPTTITTFDDGVEGERVTIFINDVNTTINSSGTLVLDSNWTAGNTGFLLLEKRGTITYEVARSLGGAGGGGPDITGTPANNQLAIWTDADTLEGDANLIWDVTNLEILRAANDGNPGIKLGASAAERLRVRTIYDAGTQLLDYVLFVSETVNTGNDDGAFVFQVDGTERLRANRLGAKITGTLESTLGVVSTAGANILLAPDTTGFLDLTKSDSATNSVTTGMAIDHVTSGTVAAGFGTGLQFRLESSTTDDQIAARVRVLWNDPTHASRKADLVLSAYDTVEREGLRIRGSGTAPMLGLYGVTPVVQPAGTGETTGFTAGVGTAVLDDSTFTGNVGSTAYRINDIVKALKQIGALAP